MHVCLCLCLCMFTFQNKNLVRIAGIAAFNLRLSFPCTNIESTPKIRRNRLSWGTRLAIYKYVTCMKEILMPINWYIAHWSLSNHVWCWYTQQMIIFSMMDWAVCSKDRAIFKISRKKYGIVGVYKHFCPRRKIPYDWTQKIKYF